jgi:hypothetical protein
LPLYPVVVYFSSRRLIRSRWLDFLATTVALATIVTVVLFMFLLS